MADAEQLTSNKRIAKNTLMLYFRTFITMIVGLYTGRVMLHALGVENYGIYNVVGGIIGFSAILTGCSGAAISRYITHALGLGDKERQIKVFSTSINAQLLVGISVALTIEMIGVWFLNSCASIPYDSLYAANWVLQCSILSLIISLFGSVFSATIIAHERMSIYAYMSIIDAILKLSICFIIQAFDGDRLILYAVLLVVMSFCMQSFYGWYCAKKFEEARYNFRIFDKALLKELSAFVGWNLFGQLVWIFASQGVNMLVNVYFGVIFNAARGIANQVNSAVQGFVTNFSTAFNPQIVKSYAAGEISTSISLANRCTRVIWMMMFLFIVPICMEAETLLNIWLGEAPPMSALFLRFAMFESLATSFGSSYLKLVQADGRMKRYVIETAIHASIIFPTSWLLFSSGAPVWSAYVVFILTFFSMNVVVIRNVKKLMPFSASVYLKEAILPCILVSVASFIVPLFMVHFMEQSLLRFFIVVPVSVLWTGLCAFYLGLSKYERQFFTQEAVQMIIR